MSDSRRIAWPWIRAVGGLAVVAAVVLGDALRPGRTLYERDLHLVVLPHTEAFVRSIAAGAWPVWNRALGFGEPLWAIPSAQVLYPPHWMNLIVQPWTYLTASAFLHLVLGGAGVYAFLRRGNAGPAAALGGGALWCASGPLLSALSYWNHFSAFAWLPWVAVAADAAMERPSMPRTLAWGAAVAMTILAGSADAAAMAVVIVAVVFAARPWPPTLALPRLAACALGAAVFSAALSAAQWMPAVELARRSLRAEMPESERMTWSVAPPALAGALLPIRLERWPLDPQVRDRWFGTREPYLASLYLGLSALPLVVLAAVTAPRRRFLAFAGLAVLSSVMALGRYTAVSAILDGLPPLRALRYPAKAMVLGAFAWVILAGLGAAALHAVPGLSRRRWRVVVIAAALAPPLALALAVRLPAIASRTVLVPASDSLDMVRRDAIALAAAAVAASVVAVLLAAARRGARWSAIAMVVPVVELALLHRELSPTAPVALLRLRPPLAQLIADSPHGRVYSYDYLVWEGAAQRHLGHEQLILREPAPVPWAGTLALRTYLYPHLLGSWGLESAYERDAHGLQPRTTDALATLLRQVEGTPAHHRLLELANVTHVIALDEIGFRDLALLQTIPGPFREPIRVYRVPDPLPPTYVVSSVRLAAGDAALAALVDPGVDLRREVILEPGAGHAESPAGGEGATSPAGSSRIVEEAPDRVVIDADLSRPGYVVLSDAYDDGWRVHLDGRPATLLRANVGFRAVAVPAGHHRLEQVYRPPSILIGSVISLIAGAAAIVASSGARRRRGDGGATASLPAAADGT